MGEKAAKAKRVGFDRLATPIGGGRYKWRTGRLTWLWAPGAGLNTAVQLREGDDAIPLVYTADIREAGMFAEGYEGGRETLSREVLNQKEPGAAG